MKEIIEAFSTRIKSPLFGYSLIAFVLINWKAIFYLFFAKVNILERFQFIENNTSTLSLLIYPIGFAIFGAIIYPWINYTFLIISKKPTELKNNIQAQSEHSLLAKKQELEKIRSSLLANKEEELIERAQRDSELESIEDIETKEKLKSQIKRLRKEKDRSVNTFNFSNPDVDEANASEILLLLHQYQNALQNHAELSKALGKTEDVKKLEKQELEVIDRIMKYQNKT